MVTDGAIKFKAYSEVKYKLEDKVRVSIPNSDFTQTKYIIGKSVKENDIIQPITYVSELDSVLSLEEDLSINNNEYGLIANDGDKSCRLIWEIDLTRQTDSVARTSICDTFYIQADFRCLLNNYKIKSGSYGLRVDFYVPVGESGNYVVKTAYMDSKDMFGNPYAFTIFSTQEKKFKLGQIGAKIDGIKIYFYQSDDFTYKKNGTIMTLEPSQFNNIFVRNIITGFGSEIANIEDNTLQIYTKQSLYYNESEASHEKDLAIAWYNKNSSNEYLGFSDGKYDKNYDEIEYLKESAKISRLTSRRSENVPDDYPGLSLAADIEELNNKLGNVGKVMQYDLKNLLDTYKTRLNDVIIKDDIISDRFEKIIELSNESGQIIIKNINDLKEQYYIWLKNAVKQLNGEELDEDFNIKQEINDPGSMEEANKAGILESIQQLIDSALTLVNYNLEYFTDEAQLLTYISKNYPAYLGICKNYKIKIENIQKQLKDASLLFNKLIYNNEDENAKGTNIDQLLAYFEEDYDFIKIDDFLKKQEDLSQYDNKYCLYWYRYNPDEIVDKEEYNFMDEGWVRLKDKSNSGLPGQGEDGYYVKDDDSVFKALKINLDQMKSEEKYALVLFYNHEQIKSNILTFTNNTEIVTDEDIALQGEVNIVNGEKSLDHYPFYGIDNLLTPSERTYERELKLEYKGTYYTADKVLPGALIKWYIPEYSSMILPISDARIKELNFVKIESDEPGYTCYQKAIDFEENDKKEIKIDEEDLKFYYKINIDYSSNFNRNMIICKISKGDILLQAEKIFTFGNEGVSGTDYDLRIRPVNLQTIIGSGNDYHQLELDISLFNGTKEIPIYTNASGLEEGEYAYNASLKIQPSNEKNFIVEELIEEGILTGCKIIYNNTNKYCGILEVQMNIGEDTDANYRVITLTQYYPIAFSPQLNENNLNMASEGASAIIYDNLGSNPSFVSKPYKLFNNEGDEYKNIEWQMMYYQYDSKKNNYVKKTKEELDDFNKKYMPTLSDKNILVPSKLYIENIDCYATVEAIDNNGGLLFVQNIIIMQNRYPSTFINQWDGSFQIDEENGTIMGTMFGAGRKNSDNQFEGVLMGDVAAGTGFNYDNKTGIGIYGFNKGAQSFAFLNDGTGFIGKSGAGRILFDGNNSIIASANWFKKGIINSDGTIKEGSADEGMAIDLKNGHIDAFNFKLSSEYLTIESAEGGLISLKSKGKNEFIKLTTKKDENNNFPLQIGSNFSVDWSGNITAEGGDIAGWKLLNKSFTTDENNNKDYFIGFSYYVGHDSLISFTGRQKIAGGIVNKDVPIKFNGPTNIGLFPNRDNVIVIGVPKDDWLFKFDSSGAETNTLNNERNFNTARFRVTNGGSVEAFNGTIGDIYIRPKISDYVFPIDIVGLLGDIAKKLEISLNSYRDNNIIGEKGDKI